MLDLLKDTLQLDIWDLNHVYANPKSFQIVQSLPSQTLPRAGLLMRIASFLRQLVKRGCRRERPGQLGPSVGAVMFFSITANQKNSLDFLARQVPEAYCVSDNIDTRDGARFPQLWTYATALAFFPLVLLKLLLSRGERRLSFRYNLDGYWLTYGYYLVAKRWLGQLTPSALVVSNDHMMPNRVLVRAAREWGIPTFYVQHASIVDELFPPLSFDYALLEGHDALKKYERAGPSNAKAFLIGMPRADAYHACINHRSSVCAVGICTNVLDPLPRAERLCRQIHEACPALDLVMRPHPTDRHYANWIALAKKCEIAFSDSRTQKAFDFLKQVDVVLAGDSNILLEAALMNVLPIYYDFGQKRLDRYGFLQNKLVEYADEPQDVCFKLQSLLENRPFIRPKAKVYCATIETGHDGHSAELAADLIKQVISTGAVDVRQWRRVPDCDLEAYELPSNLESDSHG